MTKLKLMIPVMIGLVSMVASTAHAAQDSYVVAQGDYVSVCRGEVIEAGVEAPDNIGGVCLHWSAQKTNIRVQFADAISGEHVGFYYQWYNAAGDFLTGSTTDPVTGEPEDMFGTACAPSLIPTPAGARGIKLWLDQAFGPSDCLLAGPGDSAGVATTGTVTFTLT